VGRGAGCGTGVVGCETVCKCNNFRIKNLQRMQLSHLGFKLNKPQVRFYFIPPNDTRPLRLWSRVCNVRHVCHEATSLTTVTFLVTTKPSYRYSPGYLDSQPLDACWQGGSLFSVPRSSADLQLLQIFAGNATYHYWWLGVCRRWASCWEYTPIRPQPTQAN